MPFAVQLSAFLNANLELLPIPMREPLFSSMRQDKFRATCFELIVARVLAMLGARELHYERGDVGASRPDLYAVYPDGDVVVDAVAPEFDREIAEDQRRYAPLIEMIESQLGGSPWGFWAERLPAIGPNEPVPSSSA